MRFFKKAGFILLILLIPAFSYSYQLRVPDFFLPPENGHVINQFLSEISPGNQGRLNIPADVSNAEWGKVFSGHPALIPSREIRSLITPLMTDSGSSLTLIGSRMVYIPASIHNESERWFYTSVLTEIKEKCTDHDARWEIIPSTNQQLVKGFPAGSQLVIGEEKIRRDGLLIVEVFRSRNTRDAGSDPGRNTPRMSGNSLRVPVRTVKYVPAFELVTSVPKDTVLTYEMVRVVSHSGPGDLIQTGTDLSSFETRAALPQGKILFEGDLQRARLVRRGDNITVLFKSNNVELWIPGEALSAGSLGDQVRIWIPETGKRISAVVTGKKEVNVDV